MPRETVASTVVDNGPGDIRTWSLAISWNKVGWVQANLIPDHWQDTGEWRICDLDPEQIDHLIRVLKRAKRQAYPPRV